jgi:glucan phosphoethanolaminetransferase (alkaline phosphatase superfamily)
MMGKNLSEEVSMFSTKQFTIFFLLVVVFLVAIMTVTSLAWRESSKVYDTTSIRTSLLSIVDFSAYKISEQEEAMQHWVDEVDHEMHQTQDQISLLQDYVDTTIQGQGPLPRPVFW